MQIKRHFTTKESGPYKGIKFEKRVSEIRDSKGNVIFYQDNVVVPSFWSQIATDIVAQKYFRKTGVPSGKNKKTGENDSRQVFHRLAYTWMDWGKRYGYFDTDEDAENFYDEARYMLAHQMAAPNSPQWFNTGLYTVYGIEGPSQGHYYVDPETEELKKSKSAYERPQPHACFILDVNDDLVNPGGIMDLITKEARLFKYGSGSGANYSKLRGSNEPLSGGGVSSGLLSFLKVGDRSAAAIKSGGTTRRAARMVTLDADHPDIETFIDWKVLEEQKVAALATGSRILRKHSIAIIDACWTNSENLNGNRFNPQENSVLYSAIRNALEDDVPAPFIHHLIQLAKQGIKSYEFEELNTEWDKEGYNTVSGQSSNNSVRLTAQFMKAVIDDADWTLINRTDGSVKETVKAREIWERIAYSAWSCADPGLQFHSTVNEWHTCPENGSIRASNPCSEYMFLDDTACNLASINYLKFYDKENAKFLVEDLEYAVYVWSVILEISVLMAQFPSREIAKKSYEFRTLGLGFANLGTLLMVMGIPYDSEKGRSIAAALAAILTGRAYASSALMASQLGTFMHYNANKEHMLRVIRNHRRAAYNVSESEYEGLSVTPHGINSKHCPPELLKAARKDWDDALSLGEKYGYRNAQVTAIAPTGTIGLVMDCDTTGIEPDFALVKFKKLAGGGSFKIINASLPPALKKLGYGKEEIDDIIHYCVGHGTLKGAPGVSYEALQDKGFPDSVLEKIESSVRNAFSINFAFIPGIIGKDFLTKELKIPEKKLMQKGFNLLKYLGFSEKDIEDANIYACGTMTVENAPHLKEEHYPVFDTANKSGKMGKRFIPWKAHIDMMAAVQPFVSGAISKTVNMPNNSTIEDIKSAYMYSWQNMLKAIAIYRDGSKLSQPLSSLVPGSDPAADIIVSMMRKGSAALSERTGVKTQEKPPVSEGAKKKRHSLPARRNGYTQKAKIGMHSLFIRTGEYPDGSLGEIFLDMHKEGAAFRSLLNSFAIAVSLGLQYGVPLEEYVDAFTFTKFEPNGIVLGHKNIRMTTSVLDFIFRDLAFSYLGRSDLVEVKPDDLIATNTLSNGKHADKEEPVEGDGEPGIIEDDPGAIARLKGYEGDPCPVCGNFTLVRNGTCLKCETCGSTTGCS
ncbi:MAG: adenosylcobalamin-dependent ribonucleoside-diphosphate reductase [Spirochaetales bacterium]|nr:adenosylcobalamin-dependent ribonucleoside-diphosphate reductase [Spirochaetales bacterium]